MKRKLLPHKSTIKNGIGKSLFGENQGYRTKRYLFIVFQLPFILPLYHRYAIFHYYWQKYICSLIYILIRINERIKSISHFRCFKILGIRTVVLISIQKRLPVFLRYVCFISMRLPTISHNYIKILSWNLYHTCNLRTERMCILVANVRIAQHSVFTMIVIEHCHLRRIGSITCCP